MLIWLPFREQEEKYLLQLKNILLTMGIPDKTWWMKTQILRDVLAAYKRSLLVFISLLVNIILLVLDFSEFLGKLNVSMVILLFMKD